MATKRMLIDATHTEETRVVVVDGNRLEELEFESTSRKQLKGNIYLAKVTRVEPSLQAAFVEYGGNRHGFLAFNEIHPDYYQIPVADREEFEADIENGDDEDGRDSDEGDVEETGSDDSDQVEHNRPRYRNQRRYKIQEVIKKRQILLVQVVKEERGNKGAALTTYLSLAGRYCVLMPNTDKGGGISRKISNSKDRKRLKTVLSDLKIPQGTAVIVRTAGAERSKAEIRRDFEYLMRLWSNIRDVTLQSQAPSLIYEEANLIKRSIRDMYSRDIDEVLVEGEDGYRIAKDFMKMLIPSHAKKVQPYRDEAKIPLFHRYQVESQLDAMHSPIVQLPSGGYIVINPTEALVAIDVNSGRSTKERNIEETALKTNLEAADEIARSLRLRDLAGLVVVDFIDMEVNRNQIAVERRIKDAMKNDRARIQIGRISPFGLLEMSRQRLRPSFMETSTETCHYCHGTGVRRSLESTVLHVLRAIEEEGIRRRSDEIVVHVPTQVALYILNQKRDLLADMEERYQMSVHLSGDDSLVPPEHRFERLKAKTAPAQNSTRPLGPEDSTHIENIKDEVFDNTDDEQEGEDSNRKRRRRRRGRGRRKDEVLAETDAEEIIESEEVDEEDDMDDEDRPRKRRRRGKRGGRRRTRRLDEDGTVIEEIDEAGYAEEDAETAQEQNDAESDVVEADTTVETEVASEETSTDEKPKRTRRRRPAKTEEDVKTEETDETSDTQTDTEEEKPKRRTTRRRTSSRKAKEETTTQEVSVSDSDSEETKEEDKPKRRTTRRTRTKKADADASTEVQVEGDGTSDDAETPSDASKTEVKEEKPKRRNTRRRSPARKNAQASSETTQDASSVEVKAEDSAPTPAAPTTEVVAVAEAVEPPAPVEIKEAPPVGVVVKTSDGDVNELSDDQPKKKGWWNR